MIKCSLWSVLQVCKFSKILELRKQFFKKSWEFIIFFDLSIWSMHVNKMLVQCLESTMDHSLPQVEL
jgi:hypothetical protein